MTSRLTLVALALLLTMSCGNVIPGLGATGSTSCKYAARKECFDYIGQSTLTVTTVKSSCTQNSGVPATTTCDRSGSIGGCKADEAAIMAGASIITWYFPGAVVGTSTAPVTLNTSADVMADCAKAGSDYSYQSP